MAWSRDTLQSDEADRGRAALRSMIVRLGELAHLDLLHPARRMYRDRIPSCRLQELERHFLGLASEQSVYNLMKRTVELEVIPACRAYGMAFLPYSPLAAGQLGGKPTENERGRRSFFRQSDKVDAYEDLCRSLGQRPADVALAWLSRQPGVTAPIESSMLGRDIPGTGADV